MKFQTKDDDFGEVPVKTLLIVDDQADIRELLVELLAPLGLRILGSGSGNAAFVVVERDRPDFVLTDIRMGDGDGVELIERISTLGPGRPEVAAMSGFADITLAEVLDRGAVDLFDKPFDIQLISERIGHFITPWADRWQETGSEWPGAARRLAFSGMPEALASGAVAVGRGGIFAATSEEFAVGARIPLKLTLGADTWSMLAAVRWARTVDAPAFHAGIRLEVLDADPATREVLRGLALARDAKAFVPIGARLGRT